MCWESNQRMKILMNMKNWQKYWTHLNFAHLQNKTYSDIGLFSPLRLDSLWWILCTILQNGIYNNLTLSYFNNRMPIVLNTSNRFKFNKIFLSKIVEFINHMWYVCGTKMNWFHWVSSAMDTLTLWNTSDQCEKCGLWELYFFINVKEL